MPLDGEIAFSDGTKVTVDGNVTMKDGTVRVLQEGDVMTMDVEVMKQNVKAHSQ